MSDILTRWPVRLSLPVDRDDRDAEDRLTEGAVERLFGLAADAYFALCTTFDVAKVGTAQRVTIVGVPVDGDNITISVGVIEVYPDEFTMEARLRPARGEGIAAQAKCRFTVDGGIDDAMRDEFIGLAHAAKYTN